jgi:hypothetical protein
MELRRSSKFELSLGRSVIENVFKILRKQASLAGATPQLKFLRTGLRPLLVGPVADDVRALDEDVHARDADEAHDDEAEAADHEAGILDGVGHGQDPRADVAF